VERRKRTKRDRREKGRREHGVVGPDKDKYSLVPRKGLPVIFHSSNEWLPELAPGESFLPVHVVMVEPNLLSLP
jgi:hypothetical protein